MKEHITDYINYLKDYHSLSVSLHFSEKYDFILLNGSKKALNEFNCHTNPYCFYIKNTEGLYKECMKCQLRVMKKCGYEENFTGTCHAGVREYVESISYNGEVVGFISVSGYRDENYTYNGKQYINLKSESVPVKLLKKVIPPLKIMISEYVKILIKENPDEDFYTKLISYLESNHNSVNLETLSKKFNYSKSFISHTFKKRSGKTLMDYCNNLKVRDAKLLLEQTELSITDIAFMSGFNNFSYFINVFRVHTGLTPLSWRKKHK